MIKCFIAIQFALAPSLIEHTFEVENTEEGHKTAMNFCKLYMKVHPNLNKEFRLFIGEEQNDRHQTSQQTT
jgi:hypothetical protein